MVELASLVLEYAMPIDNTVDDLRYGVLRRGVCIQLVHAADGHEGAMVERIGDDILITNNVTDDV